MVFNIVVKVTVVSKKTAKKKLKKQQAFLVKFQLGGLGPLAPPLGYTYAPSEENKKVFAKFPRGFWRFPTKFQLFKKQCCLRAEDRAIFQDSRLRGQGQGLDLQGQGQGL